MGSTYNQVNTVLFCKVNVYGCASEVGLAKAEAGKVCHWNFQPLHQVVGPRPSRIALILDMFLSSRSRNLKLTSSSARPRSSCLQDLHHIYSR